MERSLRHPLYLALLLFCLGCGDDSVPYVPAPAGGSSSGEAQAAKKACADYADAFGNLCTSCMESTFRECHDAVIRSFQQQFGGGCERVIGIRDANSFYGECLPSIMKIPCEAFRMGTTSPDASCLGQLTFRI